MADSNFASDRTVSENGQEFKAKMAFLFGITSASVLFGFGLAVGATKKRSPTSFTGQVHDEGVKLAMRALGWGTLLSVSGVTVIGVVGKSIYDFTKVFF